MSTSPEESSAMETNSNSTSETEHDSNLNAEQVTARNIKTLSTTHQSRVLSLITQDSLIAETDMTSEEKKRKLEDLYSIRDHSKMIHNEFEMIKLRRIVRNNIYPKVKFL